MSKIVTGKLNPNTNEISCSLFSLFRLRFSMINKVATTHYSFLRRQIKREDISTNAVSVTKTELYTILRDVCIVSRDVCIVSRDVCIVSRDVCIVSRDVCIVSRDVCIVSNRLTCIDAKLSEMEILAQPLSLPFIIENLNFVQFTAPSCGC
jgi:hypothetical protein